MGKNTSVVWELQRMGSLANIPPLVSIFSHSYEIERELSCRWIEKFKKSAYIYSRNHKG